jgi:hypothetical protein
MPSGQLLKNITIGTETSIHSPAENTVSADRQAQSDKPSKNMLSGQLLKNTTIGAETSIHSPAENTVSADRQAQSDKPILR